MKTPGREGSCLHKRDVLNFAAGMHSAGHDSLLAAAAWRGASGAGCADRWQWKGRAEPPPVVCCITHLRWWPPCPAPAWAWPCSIPSRLATWGAWGRQRPRERLGGG